MAGKSKTIYVCTECGFESPKWMGKCTECGEWNTMVEEVRLPQKTAVSARKPAHACYSRPLSESSATGDQDFRI